MPQSQETNSSKESNQIMKILIVEDSINDLELYKYFLLNAPGTQDYQYQIMEAVTGEQGLQKANENDFDCIVIDYQLPDMIGLDFLDKLKPSMKPGIVMITGKGNEHVAVSAIKKGVHEYLKKGHFRAHDLVMSVKKAIKNMRMSHESSEEKRNLEQRANFDSLTHTLNRPAFLARLNEIFKEKERTSWKEKMAVIFIDLDHFKAINDNFGHSVGDHFLVEIASRIQSCLRPLDLLARLGGDEFAICVPLVLEEKDCIRIGERIQKKIKDTLELDGYTIYPSASMGIAFGDQRYRSMKELLKYADAAMYEAKRKQDSHTIVFNHVMRERVQNKTKIEQDFKSAIENNEIILHYQPIISLKTHKVEGVEALARWQRKGQTDFVPPSEFIPIAEENKLINKLDRFMVTQACKALKVWRQEGYPIFVSFNISPNELHDLTLAESLSKTIKGYGLLPGWFRMEVTESCLVHHKNETIILNTLQNVVNQGLKLSLDNFGAGYSSLSYLKSLPFECIKIDRSF